jgi:hypothetical protein
MGGRLLPRYEQEQSTDDQYWFQDLKKPGCAIFAIGMVRPTHAQIIETHQREEYPGGNHDQIINHAR